MNRDKIYHHLVGFAICLATLGICIVAGIAPLPAIACGWLLTQGVATSKEAYDEAYPLIHTVDWLDMESTKAGASYAAALALLLYPAVLSP